MITDCRTGCIIGEFKGSLSELDTCGVGTPGNRSLNVKGFKVLVPDRPKEVKDIKGYSIEGDNGFEGVLVKEGLAVLVLLDFWYTGLFLGLLMSFISVTAGIRIRPEGLNTRSRPGTVTWQPTRPATRIQLSAIQLYSHTASHLFGRRAPFDQASGERHNTTTKRFDQASGERRNTTTKPFDQASGEHRTAIYSAISK